MSGLAEAWVEAAPDPVVITDGDGQVQVLNSAFERLFAISPSRLLREPIEEVVIASRFRSAYRAARRMALSGRIPGPPTSEFAVIRADGGEFAVELSVSRASEDPRQVVTRMRELTPQQVLVGQTIRRAALLESAEELAGLGSWDWQSGTQRMQWSDNLYRIYGLVPGEIVASLEYVMANLHPDDRERVRAAVVEMARTGRSAELRYRYVRPDGEVRHLRAMVASVARSDGVLRRVIGTVQDMTEQHQAEREIAAHFAVSDALYCWEPGPLGGRRLVRDLAEALDYEVGVLWVPRDDGLVPWLVWQARTLLLPGFESALRALRLARGAGLAGSAWASAQPARLTDLAADVRGATREVVSRAELREGLAVPATYRDEVLAVLTFGSRSETTLSDRFMRSLVGIGYEIGQFLARRAGELNPSALTPRELQVLQLSATGHPARQIAGSLSLSQATVKTHFEHIYKKLGVHNRASAVGEALRQGLVH